MSARADFTPDLSRVAVPTLVITSSADVLIPAAITAPMAGRVPAATLATLAGAGHLSNLEAPVEFNRLLREHLARCAMALKG